MRHAGSFLVMILLIAPIVRDCCLPITHPVCHESQHRDDPACSTNLQAITETKTEFAVKDSVLQGIVKAVPLHLVILTNLQIAADPIRLAQRPTTDIYLRTAALLI